MLCVGRRLALLFAAAVSVLAAAPPAHAALVTRQVSFRADDGVVLHATVGGDQDHLARGCLHEDDLDARELPLVVRRDNARRATFPNEPPDVQEDARARSLAMRYTT